MVSVIKVFLNGGPYISKRGKNKMFMDAQTWYEFYHLVSVVQIEKK